MSNSTSSKGVGKVLNASEEAYDIALEVFTRDAYFKSADYISDILQKLVVIDTALIGGFLGLKEMPVPIGWRLAAIISFLVSLVVAGWGVYPRKKEYTSDSPSSMETAYKELLNSKKCCLNFSAGFFIVGLVAALIGLVIVACTVSTPPPIPLATAMVNFTEATADRSWKLGGN